jgi:ribosome-binding protein aMBF1 (putative translation factor)
VEELGKDCAPCKLCGSLAGIPTYKLKDGSIIHVCRACGFHFSDHLDTLTELPDDEAAEKLSEDKWAYIDEQLQHNKKRFLQHVSIVRQHIDVKRARCLDVGAGV